MPHSPQFVRALSLPSTKARAGVEVAESRAAPLLVYCLIGLPLLAPSLILAIPGATIDGVLLFVGYDATAPTQRPSHAPQLLYTCARLSHCFSLWRVHTLSLCGAGTRGWSAPPSSSAPS